MKVLHCPHSYWQEVWAGGGKIVAICRNKRCQQRGEFSVEQWNALGDCALNKPVRV